MKAQELRIGNYVKIQDQEGSVNSVGRVYLDIKLSNKGCITRKTLCKEVEPIKLTEDWLLKFGFDPKLIQVIEDLKYYNIDIGTSFLSICIESGAAFIVQANYDIDLTINLEFVHQLQNLYFALTGKELTLKD